MQSSCTKLNLLPLSRASVARVASRVSLERCIFSYNCLSHPRLSIDSTVWRRQLQFQISLTLSALPCCCLSKFNMRKCDLSSSLAPPSSHCPPSCNVTHSLSVSLSLPHCACASAVGSVLQCILGALAVTNLYAMLHVV